MIKINFVNGYNLLYGDLAPLLWNQWIEPLAIEVNKKIYYGGVDKDGYVYSCSLNLETKEHVVNSKLGRFSTDEHNAPCHLVREGKPVLFFYAGHYEDNIKYRKTVNNEDISAYEDEQTLIQEDGSNFTYVQVAEKDNNILLFTRKSPPYHWYFLRSTDYGETWNPLVKLFTSPDDWLYAHYRQNDNIINVGFHSHPSESTIQDIYFCQINIDTGDITYPGGEVLGNLYDESTLPIDHQNTLKVYSAEDNEVTRLWEVGKNNELVFAKWTNMDNAEYYYGEIDDNGNVSISDKLGDAGHSLENEEDTNNYQRGYFAGITITDDSEIYFANNINNSNRYLYSCKRKNGTWECEIKCREKDRKIMRPYAVRNSTEIKCVWSAGYYIWMMEYDTVAKPNFLDIDLQQ